MGRGPGESVVHDPERPCYATDKLPDRVVNAVSINSFKSELENYWKRYEVLKASTEILPINTASP